MGLLYIYKPIGKTPLEVVESVKSNYTKISYAGRLDPMAHGTLLLLTDEDCNNQSKYNNLNKIYRFKLLVGIETDTNDVLGLVVSNNTDIDMLALRDKIHSLQGEHVLPYPVFSSKRYNGKPLWYYGKHNKTNEIKEFPRQKIVVNSIKILSGYEIGTTDLLKYVKNKINMMDKTHDFRQERILNRWDDIKYMNYKIIEIETDVGSGTYIRGLSRHISSVLNISTLCLDILRTSIY